MFDFEQRLASGRARPGSRYGMGRIWKTLRAAQSGGRRWLASLSMAAALALALPSFAQDLPIDVEIDLTLTALEQAMSSENHSETLAQIERLRELDPALVSGDLGYFEALAAKAIGDIERADAALVRFLSEVGHQSQSYDKALAMALELRALKAEATAVEEGISAYEAKDYAQALAILEPLAEQGSAEAQFLLGVMHDEGKGVSVNQAEAGRWYLAAAEQGHAEGQYLAGSLARAGIGGKEPDNEQAVHWFRLAAGQGNRSAQVALARSYELGTGIGHDYAEAMRWYRSAVDAGDKRSLAYIGGMYRDGLGVSQDFSEAIRWYRRAAEQGDGWGYAQLAQMYERGLGVPQKTEEATRLYRKAMEVGDAVLSSGVDVFFLRRLSRRTLTSGDWHLAEIEGRCEIYTYAAAATRHPELILATMEITAYRANTGSMLRFALVQNHPFNVDQPVTASVDGKRFSLVAHQSAISPGGSDAVMKAIRAGQSITINGTARSDGQPLSVTFSAAGFTRAFHAMAERCNRPGILSWLR